MLEMSILLYSYILPLKSLGSVKFFFFFFKEINTFIQQSRIQFVKT